MKRSSRMTPLLNQLLLSAYLLLLWQILLWAQNPGLMSDDSGEMIAGAATLGLPHPPGYPLYDLLGRLVSFVPLGSAAFRFNLLAGLVGLLSVLLVVDTCRRLAVLRQEFSPAGPLLGKGLVLFVGASLFLNRSFFAQSMTAKGLVYLLTFLLISLLVWMRVRCEEKGTVERGWKNPFLLLFLFFLGFTHHWQTQVLLVPFLALWFLQVGIQWSPRRILVGTSFSFLALSPYLYLPLRSALRPGLNWGEPHSLSQFLWVLLRKLSSQTEAAVRDFSHYALWGGEYLGLMSGTWWPGAWLVGLAGAGWLALHHRKLFLSFLALYGTVLYALLTVARGEVVFLLNVYLISLHGVFAVCCFLGLTFLFRGLGGWVGRGAIPFVSLLFCILFAGWGYHVFRMEDKSRYFLAGDLGVNVLKALPKGAVFLAEGDHTVFPILYERNVNGKRPDIAFAPAPFLLHDWGWGQLARQVGRGAFPESLFQERLRSMAEGPRPLYYSLDRQYLGGALEKLPGEFVPAGPVLEWSARKMDGSRLSEKILRAVEGQRHRGLGEQWNHPGRDPSSTTIFRYYANQHFLAAHRLHSEGLEWAAVIHLNRGLAFYPEETGAWRNMLGILRAEEVREGPK